MATVERALARYRSEGLEAAVAYHSSTESVDGRWYVFILEAESGRILAHPAEVYIGENLMAGSEAYGDAGYFYAGDLARATPEGIFVRNVLSVPTDGRDQPVPHYRGGQALLRRARGRLDLRQRAGTRTRRRRPIRANTRGCWWGAALTLDDDQGLEAALDHYNDAASRRRPVVRLHPR